MQTFYEKAWAAVCQLQNPEAEVLVTDHMNTVVAIDTAKIMSVALDPLTLS